MLRLAYEYRITLLLKTIIALKTAGFLLLIFGIPFLQAYPTLKALSTLRPKPKALRSEAGDSAVLDKSQKCFEIIVSRFLDNQRFKCRVGAQGVRAEGFQSFVALDLCRGVTCRSRTEATIVVSYTGQPLTTAGMCHWIHRSALGKALDIEVNQVRKSNRKTGTVRL